MNRKILAIYLLLQVILTMAEVGAAEAQVQLTLVPEGANVFSLRGSGLNNIAVLDFEFSYDTAAMSNPQAVRGELIPSDAIFDFNPSLPGEIRLFSRIAKKAINGSGTIARLIFEGVANAEGRILNMSANLVSVTATPVSATVRIMSGPRQQPPAPQPDASPAATPGTVAADVEPPVQPAASASRTSTTTAPSASNMPGTVTMPPGRPENESGAPPAASVPTETPPPVQQTAATPPRQREVPEAAMPEPSVTLKSVSYPGVMDRLREYGGPRTPQALAALFEPASGRMVRQEPEAAVSDGENVVRLRIDLPLTLKETPSFSLRRASMISLQHAEDGSWLIEARPARDSIDARLTVNAGGGTILFPLVVAPALEPALLAAYGSVEELFLRYLKPDGPQKDPRFDLNRDGKIDHIDDYILTVNYLAERNGSASNSAGEKRP